MRTTERKSRKDLYLEMYEAAKRGGHPFFPDTLVYETAVALIAVTVVFILAAVIPFTSAAPADPTGTAYSPRPEWYFVFFQQWLRLFPGALEPIGAIVLPLVAVVVLFLVPFLNRGLNRTWSRRKGIVAIGALVVAAALVLEVTGLLFPPALAVPGVPSPPPNATYAQLAKDGQPAYVNSCASCHGLQGQGVTAPPLWGPKEGLAKYGNAQSLLAFVSTNMPAGSPGSLSHQAYIDIAAYILIQNSNVPPDTRFVESQLNSIKLK